MPTLRFERPGRYRCGARAPDREDPTVATCRPTVLPTTTPEPAHTPLLHSTCADPPQRRAVAGLAADLARRRGRGVAARSGCLRRKSPGGRQFDVSPAARHDAQHGSMRVVRMALARWRAAGDVPTADRRIAGRARSARCSRQRCRPVGRLARCGIFGRDATRHSGPGAATAHRHRPRMVGRPLAAAARRPCGSGRRTGRKPAAGRCRRQSGVHCRRADGGDHRLVRRPDGAAAAGRRRLARADHRYTSRSRARAARAATRALSAPAGEFRADPELGRGARRPGDDLRPSHPPRRGRARRAGHACAWRCPTIPRAIGRSPWSWSTPTIAVDGVRPPTSPSPGQRRSTLPATSGTSRSSTNASPPRHVDIEMLAPWLSDWLTDPSRGVDLDAAAATLEAVDALAAVDIELLTPERLTRRTATTKGVAQPKNASGKSRFGAAAIIDWTVVVDDTPVDEALLERAAASGAGLINVNGRWVRLDRTEARRALANLAEHRRDHSELSTLELLRLAAELAPPRQCAPSADRRRPHRAADRCQRLARRPAAGSARRRPVRRGRACRDSWRRCVRISAAGSAGCSSSTSWASAVAWPTTWGSARHPRPSPTCRHCRARTW